MHFTLTLISFLSREAFRFLFICTLRGTAAFVIFKRGVYTKDATGTEEGREVDDGSEAVASDGKSKKYL